MTPNEYQKAAMGTAAGMAYDKYGLLVNGALGLCGEAGEVADIVKKATFQGHELDMDHIAEELSDCLRYIAISAQAIGWSLEELMQYNVEKLLRRYPNGFEAQRSINRPEYTGKGGNSHG